MENPATWKKAEAVIDDAIRKYDNLPGDFVGLSLARRIADALRFHGLVDDAAEREIGDEAAFGPRQPEPGTYA